MLEDLCWQWVVLDFVQQQVMQQSRRNHSWGSWVSCKQRILSLIAVDKIAYFPQRAMSLV
jgi:hypothetical protein